jgi:taurine transport system permease protein
MDSSTKCPRAAAAMILSGSAVQTKGFDCWLWSTTKRLMAACRSTTPLKTPRLRRRLVRMAKKPSTALSQLILAAWILVVNHGWVKNTLLPSPGMVVSSLVDMVENGYSGISIFTHIGISMMRVLTAYVLGSVLGTVVGLLRGRISWVDAVFLVPAEILRPIPPLGMIPLFILWFGIGELSKIILIFICVFLIMMVSAQAGSSNCPQDSIRAAQSLGASRKQSFLYVIFPSALPQIMTGLRVSMGTALSVLVVARW